MPNTRRWSIVALVAASALPLLSLIGALLPSAPAVHAEATDVVVIACENIANAVDGNSSNSMSNADVSAACGGASTALPPTCVGACPSIHNLALAIGDDDGVLEASDFRGALDEDADDNQIASGCTSPGQTLLPVGPPPTHDLVSGFACTLDVFVFVSNEQPVTLDLPAGLASVESPGDFVCTIDGTTITTDNDCSGTVPNNGDGVVLFHVLNSTSAAGDIKTVRVSQEAVEQAFDVNVVGPPIDVAVTLAEALVETNATTPNVSDCKTNTLVADAIAPPTSTLARAIVTDAAATPLTRVPVTLSLAPPSAADVAAIGNAGPSAGVANVFFTIDQPALGEPTGIDAVVCGGKSTGAASIVATITALGAPDTASAPLTVGGVPAILALVAAPSTAACDGVAATTITATFTDANNSPVADGVPVNFSLVSPGSMTPINTLTSGGTASSSFHGTPSAAGDVQVVVLGGDSGLAAPVQTFFHILCAGFDGDGDGIPTLYESAHACLNPQINDSGGDPDIDELTSLAEWRIGANPCLADTDGDGYADGPEVVLHENPLLYCPIMRADVSGDGSVSILDLATVAQSYLQSVPPANKRYDQDNDNKIGILDLADMSIHFLKKVAACD